MVNDIAMRLINKDVNVKIVCSDIVFDSEVYNDENVCRLKAKKIVIKNTEYLYYGFNELLRYNKELDMDIVHVHFSYNYLSLYTGLLKTLGKLHIPIVTTSHGLPFGYKSGFVQNIVKLLYELGKRMVLFNSTAITTISMTEYNYLRKTISPDKLFFIPNGVDISKFNNDDEKRWNIRNKLGVDKDDFLVLFFAHLRPVKGLYVFIEALKQILRKTEHVKFLIAGSGPLANEVKYIFKKSDKRVFTMLEYLPEKFLPYLYNASDVYVLPSYVEGMPLSVMEAMACGKPVIVTNVGEIPVLVKQGINGLVIPPGDHQMLADSILYLYNNHELSSRMSKENVNLMINYDWERIAKQYNTLYSEILNA